jgi:hypothetical protein
MKAFGKASFPCSLLLVLLLMFLPSFIPKQSEKSNQKVAILPRLMYATRKIKNAKT